MDRTRKSGAVRSQIGKNIADILALLRRQYTLDNVVSGRARLGANEDEAGRRDLFPLQCAPAHKQLSRKCNELFNRIVLREVIPDDIVVRLREHRLRDDIAEPAVLLEQREA